MKARRSTDVVIYGHVKYLGALWMSDLARRHPDLRLLTVSPGQHLGHRCVQGHAADHADAIETRLLMPIVFPAARALAPASMLVLGAWSTPSWMTSWRAVCSTQAPPRH